MADIKSYTNQIQSAVYGEEVRGSIVNAINAMNDESESAKSTASSANSTANAANSKSDSAISTANKAASDASSAKSSAAESATSAQNAATSAANSETEAKAAQTAAESSATDASTSATAATNAQTAAENAQTAAQNAQTAAETAQASATAAVTSAQNSADSAASSVTAAQAAQKAAEDAKAQNAENVEAAEKAVAADKIQVETWMLAASTSAQNAKTSETTTKTYMDTTKTYMDNVSAMTDIKPMAGATADADGTGGYITGPKAGDQNKFWRGDATWADVPNPTKESLGIDVLETDVANLKSTDDSIKVDISALQSSVMNLKSADESIKSDYALKTDIPTKVTLGLDKVDNTADADKPVSTATQNALNTKENTWSIATTTLAAASWSNGVYSLEGTYPNATYDVMELQPYGTADQVKAFAAINPVGSPTANTITALGTVPTIDIPVMFYVRRKG